MLCHTLTVAKKHNLLLELLERTTTTLPLLFLDVDLTTTTDEAKNLAVMFGPPSVVQTEGLLPLCDTVFKLPSSCTTTCNG